MNYSSIIALAAPAAQNGAQPNPIMAMLPLVLMFFVFYFLLIRPQQKKQKEHDEMLKSIKKGDKVITSGGIIGTVIGSTDEKVVVKVGDADVKLEFVRSAISKVVQ